MADLYDLLEKTSRTFALSIPRLPQPTRRDVGVAYLLFRIADTFEDSATWTSEKRARALEVFCDLLGERQPEKTRKWTWTWHGDIPIDHAGYQELMAEIPFVIDLFFDLRPAARDLVRLHTVRTSQGMIDYVDRTDENGELQLESIEDLRQYCYIVAGIVGEMLTELYLLERPELAPVAADLRQRARAFGEALQLVNILKDSAFDATEGRSYLAGAHRDEVFALARRDLEAAGEYVLILQRAGTDRGIIAFNALNLLLAFTAIDRVATGGVGTKIGRDEVREIIAMMDYALDNDLPVLSLEEV